MEILILCVAFGIPFIVAELLGRAKHIGRWWAFFLLIGCFVLPGIIAMIYSPRASSQPTKPNKTRFIIGVVFFVVLGLIGLIPCFVSGTDLMQFSMPVAFIILGLYLIQLGRGKIHNNTPKFYLEKDADIIPSKVTSIFKDIKAQRENYMSHFYYVIEDGKQSEPYTFEQLKDLKLQEDDMVWRHGFEQWKQAKEVKELKSILLYTPPPLPNISIEALEKYDDNLYSQLNLQKISQTTDKKTIADENKKVSSNVSHLKVLPFLKSLK